MTFRKEGTLYRKEGEWAAEEIGIIYYDHGEYTPTLERYSILMMGPSDVVKDEWDSFPVLLGDLTVVYSREWDPMLLTLVEKEPWRIPILFRFKTLEEFENAQKENQ